MKVQSGTTRDVALERIAAHCRSLDPEAPTARARLVEALGPELAAKLVFALAGGRPRVRRAA
jgi:hypothetical protein